MPVLIRPRCHGKSFELRLIHKLLEKPYYRNFDTAEDAKSFAAKALSYVALEVVPEFLLPVSRQEFVDIEGTIRRYARANGVPRSTERVLAAVSADIGKTRLSDIDYLWTEAWVRTQKLEHHRSPGTIRHHVGALARCLDWVTNAYPTYLAQNPLRKLPRGYSSCNKLEREMLRRKGRDTKEDVERNRRLDRDEEARIVAVLDSRVGRETDPAKRAWHERALLMFRLALETAMRMRELYTLEIRRAQIDLVAETVFLTRTKNGDNREVPLSPAALRMLEPPLANQHQAHKGALLFPFWNGDLSDEALDATSSRLSTYFAGVFAEAGCNALWFHDTRHEATCRLVLKTKLDAAQISRITGHKDPRMLRRYMSLRGSELAQYCWRRPNIDHPCRLNIDQGWKAGRWTVGCG